ncbi:MAG TPA: hypothetical protein VLG92_00115 [Candidatus Saccharimonadia bacterium]|nr:hypothetical protein [Candidatus Saccharimonadia bacterium]
MTQPNNYPIPHTPDPRVVAALGEVASIGSRLPEELRADFYAGLSTIAMQFVQPNVYPQPIFETTPEPPIEEAELSETDRAYVRELFGNDSPLPVHAHARVLGDSLHPYGGQANRPNRAFSNMIKTLEEQDPQANRSLKTIVTAAVQASAAQESKMLKQEGIHLSVSVVTNEVPEFYQSRLGRRFQAQSLPEDQQLVLLHTPEYGSDLDTRPGNVIVIAAFMEPNQTEYLLELVRKDPFTVLETALLAATTTYRFMPLSPEERNKQWLREKPTHFEHWRQNHAGVVIRRRWPFTSGLHPSDERLGNPNYREPTNSF